MKNLITDFGIFINENYSFDGISLTEKENEKSGNSLSELSSATGLVCASAAPTTNATAFKSLMEGFSEDGFKKGGSDKSKVAKELLPLVSTSIKDDKDAPVTTMKEDQALFFKNGRTSVGPKTDKTHKNYIKLDDIVILESPDKGDLTTKEIQFKDLNKEGKVVEASGNGIFVLGRLLKTRALGTINDDTKVYLGMNYLKPTVLVANANTGIQGKSPWQFILTAMMSKKYFIPNNENLKAFVVAGRNLAKPENKEKADTIFARTSVPIISMHGEEYLQKNLNLELWKEGDATTVSMEKAFNELKPEAVQGEPSEYQQKQLVNIYLEVQKRIAAPWFTLIGERLKYFYNDIISTDFGVPDFVFEDINKQIDKSIKSIIEKNKNSESNTYEWAKKEIAACFLPKPGGSVEGDPGAKATMELLKQVQGGI